jgi:hypothetical protein
MAAMMQADTDNLEKLKAAFPDVYAELSRLYNTPGILHRSLAQMKEAGK